MQRPGQPRRPGRWPGLAPGLPPHPGSSQPSSCCFPCIRATCSLLRTLCGFRSCLKYAIQVHPPGLVPRTSVVCRPQPLLLRGAQALCTWGSSHRDLPATVCSIQLSVVTHPRAGAVPYPRQSLPRHPVPIPVSSRPSPRSPSCCTPGHLRSSWEEWMKREQVFSMNFLKPVGSWTAGPCPAGAQLRPRLPGARLAGRCPDSVRQSDLIDRDTDKSGH